MLRSVFDEGKKNRALCWMCYVCFLRKNETRRSGRRFKKLDGVGRNGVLGIGQLSYVCRIVGSTTPRAFFKLASPAQ